MSLVQRIGPRMISEALRSLDISPEAPGESLWRFMIHHEQAGELIFVVQFDGDRLSILGGPSGTVPRDKWPTAVAACNAWNAQAVGPKTYLEVSKEDGTATIWADEHYPGTDGTAELIQNFVQDFASLSVAFSAWLWGQFQIPVKD